MAGDGRDNLGPAARLAELADLATPFALRTAVTLGVPDRIGDGVTGLAELAEACGADVEALGRLLGYLVHQGVFTESAGGYGLTPVGELLRDREGGGHGAYLDLDGLGARMDLAYRGLPHSIRTGEPGYATVHGRDLWADLDARPDFRAYFDDLMLSQQKFTAPQVAALYPWDEAGHVVDVGGGSGGLLAEVLGTHRHLRGTVVDRAEPVGTARETFARLGLGDRAEGVVGDFFDPLPGGADVYVISRALTDWSDRHATAILRRCAEAAGADGRVLIVEVLPTEPYVRHLSPYDLKMLAVVGGRERDEADHIALAAAAGLVPRRSYQGTAGLTLLEFAAAG